MALTMSRAGVLFPEVVQHHRAGPDLADRIRDAPAGNSGAAVDGLKQRRELPLGIDIAEGAMPIVPVQAGPRSDRMSPNRFAPTTTSNQSGADEVGGQDVDVVVVQRRRDILAIAATRSSQ